MSKIVKGVAIAFVAFVAPVALAFLAPTLLSAGVVTALNYIGVASILNGISKQLAAGSRPPRPGTTIEYSGTVEPRRIIYGEVRVSGMHVIPALTSGTNNKMLHRVLAIAGHEVYAMPTVYFNNEAIGTIGSITGASTDGLVSTGDYANKAWVRRYMGTSTQTADYILDTGLSVWTSNHRGRGVAYLAIQLEYDEKVYKAGVPETTVLVQGKKVYDPRKDSTNGGSGSHRLATPSTWEYSNNPALCLADYITDSSLGMGESQSRVDWAMVATAADECDELVTVPTASTQKRYTCNAVLLATDAYQDNIDILTGAMLGFCIYSGGKWRIGAGSWGGTQFTLSDDDVVGSGASITTAIPYRERYNGIRGSFVNPADNYQLGEFPPTQSASYVTDDGESVFKDVRFDACTNVYEATRAAILMVRKSRNRQFATVSFGMSAFRVRPGETGIVTITALGWSTKTVRCESWRFNAEGYVELGLREELSSDWNDPLEADYTTPLAISNPTPVYFTPDAPSALSIVNTPRGPQLSWTAPAIVPAGSLYEVWEYTSSTPFASATKVWEGISTNVLLPKTDQTTRYYWVLLRTNNGTAGPEHPTSAAGVAGAGILVGSGLIEDGAVTVLASATQSVAGAGETTRRMRCEVAFTPDVDCEVEVFAIIDAQCQFDGDSGTNVFVMMVPTANIDTGSGFDRYPNPATGVQYGSSWRIEAGQRRAQSSIGKFTATAGTSYTAAVASLFSIGTVALWDLQIFVYQVKR